MSLAGLAVIAREDAQAAGVDRKTLVKSELGAEVGDQVRGAQPLGAVTPQRLVVVSVVDGQDAVVIGEENRILHCIAQHVFIHPAQEGLGVVPDRVPQTGVQSREQRAVGRSQLYQRLEASSSRRGGVRAASG